MRTLFSLCLITLVAMPLQAGEVTVAVAANFKTTLTELAEAFSSDSGHRVRISSASTGALYNQIVHGAGFDVFLAADRARPERLEQEGLGIPGSRFTYARGQLVLLPADSDRYPLPATPETVTGWLRDAPPRTVAIANPALAPYGAAARAVLRHMGVWENNADSRVMGGNIAQAYQFVATGNARLGFVALSQMVDPITGDTTPHWPVPTAWHPPIEQQGIQLTRARDHDPATEFMQFLRGPRAGAIIIRHGYRNAP